VDNQKEGHFEQCRDDCLHTIQAVLCATTAAPAPAAAAGSQVGAEEASAEAVAASGWQLQPCLPHWLRLHHPVLDLQLDVHVSPSAQQQAGDTMMPVHPHCAPAQQQPTAQAGSTGWHRLRGTVGTRLADAWVWSGICSTGSRVCRVWVLGAATVLPTSPCLCWAGFAAWGASCSSSGARQYGSCSSCYSPCPILQAPGGPFAHSVQYTCVVHMC
jgi:hypothetical protein